jgi:hypothetical protein
MKIETHTLKKSQIVEVLSDGIIIQAASDGLTLLGDLYYQGFYRIILHEKNITPAFFDLKNGLAGELLQKFSNYRVRLAIVGDFTNYTSKSIRDFIYESNRGRQVAFVSSTDEALQKLANE